MGAKESPNLPLGLEAEEELRVHVMSIHRRPSALCSKAASGFSLCQGNMLHLFAAVNVILRDGGVLPVFPWEAVCGWGLKMYGDVPAWHSSLGVSGAKGPGRDAMEAEWFFPGGWRSGHIARSAAQPQTRMALPQDKAGGWHRSSCLLLPFSHLRCTEDSGLYTASVELLFLKMWAPPKLCCID